jgi:hypothetical protein
MTKNKIWIAIGLLVLPLLFRALWFYPGFTIRPKIATPDYASFSMPQAPLQTPFPDEHIKQLGGVVLVDTLHANQYQPGEIEYLKEQIEKRGGQLEFISDPALLESRLKYASAYVIISPATAISPIETNLIRSFVDRGGRLLVFSDATRGLANTDFFTGTTTVFPDTYILNPLLEIYGITINNDYMYNLSKNEGNFRNVYFEKFGKDELTFGLKQVILYGTHSVKSDSGLILLRGTESTFSSISDAFDPAEGSAAMNQAGNVLVFGDFTFLTPPYNNVADNSTLISNIADFLLAGRRTPSLANFPYLFNQAPVQVFLTSDLQLTAEVIAALSRLQTFLQSFNISMEMVTEKPVDGNVLILGTFAQNVALDPIVSRFNLTLDDKSDSVSVPGFGKVGHSGNGILLFDSSKKGNTLVLLADTVDDLNSLLDTISGGSLTACVLQKDIGVCGVGVGSSFSGSETTIPTGQTNGEGTTTPEPAATPAG